MVVVLVEGQGKDWEEEMASKKNWRKYCMRKLLPPPHPLSPTSRKWLWIFEEFQHQSHLWVLISWATTQIRISAQETFTSQVGSRKRHKCGTSEFIECSFKHRFYDQLVSTAPLQRSLSSLAKRVDLDQRSLHKLKKNWQAAVKIVCRIDGATSNSWIGAIAAWNARGVMCPQCTLQRCNGKAQQITAVRCWECREF